MNKTKLIDIALINHKSLTKREHLDEIEYIDISSVGTGVLLNTKKMAFRNAPSRARRLVNAGDTILSTVRPNRRSFLYIKSSKQNLVVSTGFAVLTPTKRVDSRYLYYIINDQSVTDYLTNSAKGAAYPAVDTEIVGNINFNLPNLKTQQKIASILSAYDDLIENNLRRIKILEEMAQTIYKEWFVNFRFPAFAKATAGKPGYEKVKSASREGRFVDSPLGQIPEGWEVKFLNEVSKNFDSKRKPISSLKRKAIHGEYPYYGAAKVIDYVNDFIFDGKYLLLAEDGSVITKGNKPVLQFVNEKFWANNHTHILQGIDPTSTEYLYLFLSQYNIVGHITGVAQPKINQGNLNRIKVLVADKFTMKKFNEIIIPKFDLINSLKRKNENLRKTRDLLLPKLMSGEVPVAALLNKNGEA